jgi:hypothetical protein
MISKYDLSNIPEIPLALPLQSRGPPICTANALSSCNWGCTNCMRSTDIWACPDKKDWGLSYDDGSGFVNH